jgi:hypothetical protein
MKITIGRKSADRTLIGRKNTVRAKSWSKTMLGLVLAK